MMQVPQPSIWIIIASASQVHFYSTKKVGGNMHYIESMDHPQSREKREDMVTDRPGMGHNYGAGYGSLPASSDPKEVENERFAKEVSHHLRDHALKDHFDRLVIVAPPQFMGKLLNHADSHWHDKIYLRIEKDYVHVPEHELPNYLEAQMP